MVERGFERFDYDGDALGRQPGAEDDENGGEYKDDRRDSNQEHVSQRFRQGPLGTAGESKKQSLSVRAGDGSVGNK